MDEGAATGARFSASHVPQPTGRGRFDLPRDLSPVLYLAESAEHAVAELLQPWRGRRLEVTQPMARAAWERGASGVRWWSSFWGDWRTVVLFMARTADSVRFSQPEVLSLHSAPVQRAADLLGMASPPRLTIGR